ncbi:hypothetical protein AAMO2058_001035900 [Amorphochlora amoebiformis]
MDPRMPSAKMRGKMAATHTRRLDMKKINALRRTFPVDFQSETNFNPFKYWKGKDNEAKLAAWRKSIDDIVDQILNVYTKGFNEATSSFSQILLRFSSTQQKVDKLLENLKESQRILKTKPDALRDLHLKKKRLEKILDILAKVEYVVGVPKQVDQFVSRKQYLHAVELVLHTLNLLLARDLNSFGALEEVRQNILNQKNALQEKLIDHLHSHIYQNSGNSEDIPEDTAGFTNFLSRRSHRGSSRRTRSGSWRGDEKIDDSGHQERSTSLRNSENRYYEPRGANIFSPFRDVRENSSSTPSSGALTKTQLEAKESETISELLREEKSDTFLTNPDGNSALLKSIILESMNKLGRLPSCQAALKNRVNQELKKIIDIETDDLKQKYSLSQTLTTSRSRNVDPWELVLKHSGHGSQRESLKNSQQRLLELMNNVFGVFTRVLQNHIDVWNIIRAKKEAKEKAEQLEIQAKKIEVKRSHSDDLDEILFSGIRQSDLMLGTRPKPKPKQPTRDVRGVNAWFVWEAIQTQLVKMLRLYWKVNQQVDLANQDKQNKLRPGEDLKLDFRFEFSDIPSVAALARENPTVRKVETKKTEKKEGPQWIEASPYHVPACYRRVVAFIDQAHSMVDDSPNPESSSLRNFMNNFIRQEFIPRVQADAHKIITRILCDTASFKPFDTVGRVSTDDVPSVLVHSSIRFSRLVNNLMRDMLSLPHSVSDYLRVVELACDRYLQHCEEKFKQQLPSKLYSAQVLGDVNFLKLCKTDKRSQRVFGTRGRTKTDYNPQSVFKVESQHFYILYMQHLRLSRDQLLWETWDTIALLCESMHWVSRMMQTATLGALKGNSGLTGEEDSYSLEFVEKPQATVRSFLTRRQYRSASNSSVGMNVRNRTKSRTGGGMVETKTSGISSQFRDLAQRCLFTLRIEVQMHCFYHLGGMVNSDYALKAEAMEPEDFIMRLNTDLTNIDDALTKYLEPAKVQYVFAGLDQLVCSVLVRTLPLIAHRRISRFGVLQITRNLYALQQNLTHFARISTNHFDHARRYFELLDMSLEDFQQFRAENPKEYTSEEYKAVTDTYAAASVDIKTR